MNRPLISETNIVTCIIVVRYKWRNDFRPEMSPRYVWPRFLLPGWLAIISKLRHMLPICNKKIFYSKCLKSKRSDFGGFEKCSIPKRFRFRTVSEIRTISFGFQTFGLVVWFVRFIFFTKLDPFIYKKNLWPPLYIKRSSLLNRTNRTNWTEQVQTEHICVWFAKRNVRFSDIYCICV